MSPQQVSVINRSRVHGEGLRLRRGAVGTWHVVLNFSVNLKRL